jgi:hypothetical protein
MSIPKTTLLFLLVIFLGHTQSSGISRDITGKSIEFLSSRQKPSVFFSLSRNSTQSPGLLHPQNICTDNMNPHTIASIFAEILSFRQKLSHSITFYDSSHSDAKLMSFRQKISSSITVYDNSSQIDNTNSHTIAFTIAEILSFRQKLSHSITFYDSSHSGTKLMSFRQKISSSITVYDSSSQIDNTNSHTIASTIVEILSFRQKLSHSITFYDSSQSDRKILSLRQKLSNSITFYDSSS